MLRSMVLIYWLRKGPFGMTDKETSISKEDTAKRAVRHQRQTGRCKVLTTLTASPIICPTDYPLVIKAYASHQLFMAFQYS